MRRKLIELAGRLGAADVRVVATYGFTEAKTAWGECPVPPESPPSGYHLYPDLGLFEVIDPETGAVLPEGSPGELVYTPLDARGSVVLRYRTGDFIDGGLVYEPCPHCGRAMPRLVGAISRQAQMKEMQLGKLKGTLIDFNELEHVLDDEPRVGSWQIELRKKDDDPMSLDELILHVVHTGDDEASMKEYLGNLFARSFELRPNLILFHSDEEMRDRLGISTELKPRRVADYRAKPDYTPPPRTWAEGQRGEAS
jgi:phenylacetate-coenzyme A ligase PaaK-like adenylate-forming protein